MNNIKTKSMTSIAIFEFLSILLLIVFYLTSTFRLNSYVDGADFHTENTLILGSFILGVIFSVVSIVLCVRCIKKREQFLEYSLQVFA